MENYERGSSILQVHHCWCIRRYGYADVSHREPPFMPGNSSASRVGLNALSLEEERFHFGMWAIHKSPLTIGARMVGAIPAQASLDILSNAEVIALNQDPLGKAAQLIRRYTEGEWDLWSGELSGSRVVLGIANWRNDSQTVQVDLAAAGVASADVRDVWAAEDLGALAGLQTVDLAGHEMKLLVLSNIVPAAEPQSSGYYSATNATSAALAGGAVLVTCPADECLPTNQKVGNLYPGASVTISSVTAASNGTKLIGVDFINYEVALATAWDWGSNTRNMTISVNGGEAKRWAFPISGGDWYETGRLMVEVDGFVEGSQNAIVFGAPGDDPAPDLVGVEVFA
jgi:alpha-galactosidase